MNIARSSTDVLCAQFCQNNHRECRTLSQNQAHVRAHCGAQTDATMKIAMCARVMIFFQPLLLVNFVVDRNEACTAKSCLRCTRKSVSEFNLRYLNSIPKRVTARFWRNCELETHFLPRFLVCHQGALGTHAPFLSPNPQNHWQGFLMSRFLNARA